MTKGMTVWIGTTAGTHDIGIYRVRKAPGATTLYLAEISDGDPGRVAQTELKPLADNAYITIILDHNVWSVFPRIDFSGGSGVFYKDQEIAYSNQNSTVIACPLNLGAHKAGWVNGSNVLAHTFTATISAFDGATVSAYAWFVDEVSAGTSSSLAYNYPTGHHLTRCTVTLSNGASITAIRHVWAHHPTNYPPLEITISSDTRNRRGRRFSVELISSFDNALREGALCCIWEDVTWGAHTISSAITSTIGFIDSITSDSARAPASAELTAQLEIISPLLHLEKLTAFSQQLSFAASPATWQEAIAALMHLDYFVFYLLYYHTTILSLCDFNKCGLTTYTAHVWRVDSGSNVVAQINRVASRVNVEITQTSDGALWLRRDPAMMGSSSRSGVVERYPLTANDIERISRSRRVLPEYAYVECNGFPTGTSTPSTAYRSQAAGRVGGQGAQSQTTDNQLVIAASAQTELNERAGNALAKVNNPHEQVTITLNNDVDVIEPALRYFLPLDLAASYNPEGSTIDTRLIPETISMNYAGNGSRTITVTAAEETIGYNTPGQTMPIRIGNGMDDSVYPLPDFSDSGYPILNFDPLGYPVMYGLPELPSSGEVTTTGGTPGTAEPPDPLVISWGLADAGYIDDPTAVTPDWVQFFSESGQGVRWMVWNQLSSYVQGSGTSLEVWAITGNKLWGSSDLISTPLTVKQGSLTGYYFVLRNARGVPGGEALIAYGRASGTNGSTSFTGNAYVLYSANGGNTVTETDLGTGGGGGMDCDDYNLGVIITTHNKIVEFRTTYGSGSFTAITGLTQSGASSTIVRDIRIPYLQINSPSVSNNSLTAIHFLLSIGEASSTHYLFKCVLNTSTGVATETGITPDISGTKYNVGNTAAGIEVYGGDGRRILMLGFAVDGSGNTSGTAKIIGSTDGGATWSIMSSPAFSLVNVHFVEPEFGGDGLKCWFAGDGGIYYSDDFGATLTNKSGDFAADVSSLTSRQMVAAIHAGS